MKTQLKIEVIIRDPYDKEVKRIKYKDAKDLPKAIDDCNFYDHEFLFADLYINDERIPDFEPFRKEVLSKYGLTESEDNSIEAMVYQGKSIAQWEKDFNGEFTAEQLAKMARGSVDLQKLLYSNDLNEEDDQLLDAKEFFEETAKEKTKNDETAIDESSNIDIKTISDLISRIKSYSNMADKVFIQVAQSKQPLEIVDISSKNGSTIIEVMPTNLNEETVKLNEETNDPEDVVTVKDFIHLLREKTDLDDKLSFRANKKECVLVDVDSKSGTSVVDLVYGKDKMLENEEDMKESYSWRRGGYGGTGRSYSSLGDRAPRGAAIGWFNVDEIDPKAKGKMYGWRMGPSNFPFEDLLYPERKYKVGTTTMRNKYVKAGSMSGEKYIAIPSYFSAIKDNDQEAINLLNALGIPLDLTFGMDPNDDYSMTYTVKQ